MDIIKVFAKNKKELETLIQTIRIYSQDREMEFGIEKCTMLIMRCRKTQITEEIELANEERIWTLWRNEPFKYLGKLEVDTIQQAEKKERIRKASQKNEKTSRKQALPENSHQSDKHLDCHPM